MSIKRFDWQWNVPEDINIGHLCSSIHLGSDVENKLAMIVENDELGTSEVTFKELAKKNRSIRSVSFKFWLKKRRSCLNSFTQFPGLSDFIFRGHESRMYISSNLNVIDCRRGGLPCQRFLSNCTCDR